MSNVLRTVSNLQQKLAALLPMRSEDQARLDKKFRLEFNYNSNHLEGNTLTYSETELLLIFDDTKGGHQMREYEEMKAHDVAWHMVQDWAADAERPLSETDIKNLNQIILVRPYWKDAETADGQKTRRQIKVGDYKSYPNSVRLTNGEIFHYASVADTPILMGELIAWYREEEEKGELHALALAAMLHYRFVRIHPFDDGNGRISRILMNYVLLRNGLQPVLIKSADKQAYLSALHRADTGNLDAFVDYIAIQEQWSLELAIKAAGGKSIDEPGDLAKKLSLLKRKIGQGIEAKESVKYSLEAFKGTVEHSIKLLLNDWELKLREFDVLFFSRKTTAKWRASSIPGNDINEVFSILYKDFILNNDGSRWVTEGQEFTLSATFQRLRNIKTLTTYYDYYNAGEINCSFFTNAYEIKFTGAESSISKLYNEVLSDEERAHIVEALGTHLYNVIEQALQIAADNGDAS